MPVRQHTLRSLALAAALAAVATPLSAQQDTTKLRRTTSDKRINVSKGEVEVPQKVVDTVYITTRDTLRVEVTRIDTVTVTPPPPPVFVRAPANWYWGLFAGGTGPTGDIDRIQTNGYHAGGVTGWEPQHGWFGARLTGSYTQVGREQGLPVALVGTRLPMMWQFSTDLKAKANVGGWAFYGVGGLGFNSFKRMATVSDNNDLVVNPLDANVFDENAQVCTNGNGDDVACYRLPSDSWRTKFSWNFGFGTDFHIGRQDMFLEWRWNPVQTDGAYTWYMPISLGLRYF
jgi:hypothetical protein